MYAHSRCGWTCDVRGQPVGSPAGFRWDARVGSSLPTLMEIIIARARAAVPMSRGILLLPRAGPTDCLWVQQETIAGDYNSSVQK
jgi:hypothetical protein